MRKYSGALGRFSYQEDQFCLNMDADGKQYLEYIGTEMDGAKISLPKGIVDGTGMFQDKPITSQPKLPGTLRIADCMFAGCENLKETGSFPERLAHADYMYACCPSLEKVSGLPDGLQSAQGMFDSCTGLKEMPKLPEGIQNIKYMFWSCPNLKQSELPSGIDKDDVFGVISELTIDDLSDLPDTVSFQEETPALAALFGKAEELAAEQRPQYNMESEKQEETKMSQEEREGLLAVLDIDGLDLTGLELEAEV